MKPSKRFVAWVIASRADPFRRARLSLSLLYTGLIALVVILLSSITFTVHGSQVREQSDREHLVAPASGEHRLGDPVLEEYLERLGRSMFLLDALTILVAGALSYFLAGRTLRPIRATVQAEQQFFAAAAHDLRTPLAVMKTEIEVARRGGASLAEARSVMDSSLEEIDRMAALVEDLLVMARHGSLDQLGAGPRREREAHDLADLIATTVERFRHQAAELRIDVAFQDTEPILASVDAVAMERAMSNVIENALKFAPAGGRVGIRLQASRRHIEVMVEDDGPGIAAADLPRVCEPFYRADAARTTPGSGLGLAIVKQIMIAHRGSLDISSQAGQGTKVRLRLPRE